MGGLGVGEFRSLGSGPQGVSALSPWGPGESESQQPEDGLWPGFGVGVQGFRLRLGVEGA